MDAKIGRSSQPRNAGNTQRRDKQPEPRDLGRERIEIDARHRTQRVLRLRGRRQLRRIALPLRKQAFEPAQQKMAGATGRIDHPHRLVAELGNGGIERARKNPFFHEIRRLQQRITLAGVL